MKSDISAANIRRCDLNLLWVFYAVLKYRKLTVAARRLSMTQSAVSQALARLRRQFNDELFVRTGQGLRPTTRALELEPFVSQIIEIAVDQLLTEDRFDPDMEADFRVGIPDNVSRAFASFLGSVHREAPKLRITTHYVWGRKGVDALLGDEIDLAIFHIADATPEIERRTLYEESFAVIARAGHPLTSAPLNVDRFAAAEHIVTSFAGDQRGRVDATLERLGHRRRVVATLPLFHATMLAVARSEAIALTNRSLALAQAGRYGLAVLEPPTELELRPYPVHVAWHRRRNKCAVRRWVSERIERLMPENFADG